MIPLSASTIAKLEVMRKSNDEAAEHIDAQIAEIAGNGMTITEVRLVWSAVAALNVNLVEWRLNRARQHRVRAANADARRRGHR